MTTLPLIDMTEATRLTREGRLDEAMAVLRGVLGGAPPAAAPSPREDGAPQQQTGRTPPTLDMMPPSVASGGAWTAPQPGPAHGWTRRDGASHEGAPSPLPDGARFGKHVYANEAGRRAYKLYVPSGYQDQALPLVVMLHGCTQSPDDFAAGTRMNLLAEEQTFLVAYPAQPASANSSKCWNWFRPGDQQRDRGEPALIAGLTRQIMRDVRVERGRVYVAGLSAGGAAAAILASAYPDLYAAVGVHSGLACGAASDVPSAFAAMRQGGSPAMRRPCGGRDVAIPTIVFHGDADPTVNPINGDQVISQFKGSADLRVTVSRGSGPGATGYTRTVHADESGRAVLEQWVLHGGRHAWSGGSADGSFTDPRGPDASRAMIRFFLQHSMAIAGRS